MKSNKSMIGVIAAVVLALLGGLLLWQNSGSSESDATENPAATIEVVTAALEIGAGESAAELSENDYAYVALAQVPADQVPAGALTSLTDLEALALGRNVVNRTVPVNSILTLNDFTVPGTQVVTGIEAPANTFEMTMAMDPQRALGGQVLPGNEIAVLASFQPEEEAPGETVLIIERALVTDVRTESLLTPEQQAADPLNATLATTARVHVTVALEVQDLEKLTYAVEFGEVWLVRQGDAATVDDSFIRNRENAVTTVDGEGPIPFEEIDLTNNESTTEAG